MENELKALLQAANTIILGKELQIKLAVCCLLAKGHLLIEDVPGVGKTTLSHTLAKLLGLNYQRIQFTSDILPADIIGSSVFNAKESQFSFQSGPIFNQMILADEINRSTPKAQSALLEAMEEQQVTVEGKTYPLPNPFFVIATQNPSHQIGTFPLPESQLDRFLMRIELGYPCRQAERELLEGNAKIIKLIARDEALHLTGTQHILNNWISGKDDPEMQIISQELRNDGLQIFLDVVEQEKEWAQYLFKDGSMIGLNAEILNQYIEYISNQRLTAIGFDAPFNIKSNPLPWMNSYLVSDNVQVAPQETEISSYLVGQVDSSVNADDFDDFDL